MPKNKRGFDKRIKLSFSDTSHWTWMQWRDHANGYYNADRYQQALEAYERALQLNPTSPHLFYKKGWALFSLERYEEALEAFEQAQQLDEQYGWAYYGQGRVFFQWERWDEAFTAFERAQVCWPGRRKLAFYRCVA
jgi:tetratricopeptide (TPR) repeat protein